MDIKKWMVPKKVDATEEAASSSEPRPVAKRAAQQPLARSDKRSKAIAAVVVPAAPGSTEAAATAAAAAAAEAATTAAPSAEVPPQTPPLSRDFPVPGSWGGTGLTSLSESVVSDETDMEAADGTGTETLPASQAEHSYDFARAEPAAAATKEVTEQTGAAVLSPSFGDREHVASRGGDTSATTAHALAPAGAALASTAASASVGALPGGSSGETKAVEVATSAETMFLEGAENGFALYGTKLGKAWYGALKADPLIAKEYRELGRSYEAQRSFRQRWAATAGAALQHQRLQVQSRLEEDEDVGEYEGISRLIFLEQDEAAGKTYAASCDALDAQGIKFRGKDLVRWNAMTNRAEYLYIKARFRSKFSNLWEERCEHEPTMSSTMSVAAEAGVGMAASTPQKLSVPTQVPGTPGPPPKKNGKQTGGGKSNGPSGEDPEPSPDKAKKTQTPIDKELMKLKLLKIKMIAAQTEGMHLIDTIGSNDEWMFARPATQLKEFHHTLTGFRCRSGFWEYWSLNDTNKVKQKYGEAEIKSELRNKGELEKVVDALETEMACIKASFHVRATTARNRKR
jgi:hypothetical protein